MIQLLVTFYRLDHRDQVSFGDAVVAAPSFPAGEDDIERLRQVVKRIVIADGGVTERIVFNNIVRLDG